MINAPSVTYPVGRFPWAGRLLPGLWLSGVFVACGWAAGSAPSAWRLACIVVSIVVMGGFAAWSWQRTPVGDLAWKDGQWRWEGDGEGLTGAVECCLDLQTSMLVRFEAHGTTRRAVWLMLARANHPAKWNDLRRAVYSRARIPPSPASESAAANPPRP